MRSLLLSTTGRARWPLERRTAASADHRTTNHALHMRGRSLTHASAIEPLVQQEAPHAPLSLGCSGEVAVESLAVEE